MFKEKYIEFAEEFAIQSQGAFGTIPVVPSVMAEHIKRANKARKKLDKLCANAQSEGNLGEIGEFLNHSDNWIRCVTAMYYLFVDPEIAMPVLEELEKASPPNPVGAQVYTILHAWNNGAMKL